MTRNHSVIRIAWRLAVMLVGFAAGVSVASALASMGKFRAASAQSDVVQRAAAPATPACEAESPASPDDQGHASTPPPLIPPLAVSPSRLLVTDGSTLYMLDAKSRVVWQWAGGESFGEGFITTRPVLIGNTIHVVGREMTIAALDAKTGAVKHAHGSPYGAHFTQMEKYVGGQYLAVLDLSEVACTPQVACSEANMLQAYKGDEMQWQVEFPRGAQLYVRGGKIYAAIYRAAGGVEMREIEPPDVDEFACSC